ncbi:MAG: cytochrome c biogenesis protein CcmG/thiol:disulfide interchange protein DsbE [Flavobacteriales bacterium]|jgi:cytochrome c biogenesis protein CcmG/thiol:disulfide interchange protein DsbE
MRLFITAAFLSLGSLMTMAQSLPEVTVKSIDGNTINTSTISNDGKPMIVSFWATWCKPCVRELTAIADVYADWQEETGVKLIAVSIDDARNTAKVLPFISAKGWEYEILLDVNQDFKRALNVNTVPHTFIIDGSGKIVYQHTSYAQGDEDDLYEMIEKLASGEEIGH